MNGDLISRSAVCAKCGAKGAGELFSCSDECLIFPGNVPSVDAVEVVRCKDCKHYVKALDDENIIGNVCDIDGFGWADNDFCSYGERKDHEAD